LPPVTATRWSRTCGARPGPARSASNAAAGAGSSPPRRSAPLGVQPAGGEAQRCGRRLVGPLHVVDDAEQRALLGDLAQQVEQSRRHQEPVAAVRGRDAQRRAERARPRCGQPVQPVQPRCQQLVERGEGQLGLRLHATGSQHLHAGQPLHRVGEQRRLADPRLAQEDERAAATVAYAGQQAVDRRLFRLPAVQHR
jgi:hypothetical protein